MKTIVENGPRADDLQKVKENMLKEFDQNLEQNDWWNETVLYNYYVDGIDYRNQYKAAVEAVTAETIHCYLKDLLSHH